MIRIHRDISIPDSSKEVMSTSKWISHSIVNLCGNRVV